MPRRTPPASPDGAAILRLEAVCKSLAGHPAVQGVSLEIRRGEFFSLLGPSGCGKTTLLRLIAGFERADAGQVRHASAASGDPRPAYARDVNMVFQHYALFPHLTVAQNIAFGLEMGHVPADEIVQRTGEAIARVHLAGYESRYPGQLSGGQQQRVALARAIVTRPAMLLLDEPLGALDLKLRRAMQGELKALQRELGITFVYVTHDQEEALALSDRLAVMHQGRILQVGTPAQLYDHPASRFVAEFVGEMNILHGVVGRRRGRQVMVGIAGQSLAIPWTAGLEKGARVTLGLRPERLTLGARGVSRAASLDGVVDDRVYLGSDIVYRVRISDEFRVRVRHPYPSGQDWSRGDRVRVRWPGSALCVLADDIHA